MSAMVETINLTFFENQQRFHSMKYRRTIIANILQLFS